MTDYAAAPLQSLAQCEFTGTAADGACPFVGKGFSSVVRSGSGNYILTLDLGLPGLAGEVQPNAPDIRTLITVRGATGTPTTAACVSVAYIDPGAVDGGEQQVQITFQTTGAAPVNPLFGCEVIMWRGLPGT